MLNISKNTMGITRGDSAYIHVSILQTDGTPYEMQSGDTLTLTAKKDLTGAAMMSVTSSTPTVHIQPAQSRRLEVGRGFFDLQLATAAGEVYTIIGPENPDIPNLTVYPEVTQEV